MTPHKALEIPLKHNKGNLQCMIRGTVQSLSKARSLKRSARRRYFWGSLPRDEEASQAKRMVARRPVESWTTVRRTRVRN
jgi:hypothetical protein